MPKISVDTFYPDKEEVLDPETDLPGDADLVHKLEINELSRISVRNASVSGDRNHKSK